MVVVIFFSAPYKLYNCLLIPNNINPFAVIVHYQEATRRIGISKEVNECSLVFNDMDPEVKPVSTNISPVLSLYADPALNSLISLSPLDSDSALTSIIPLSPPTRSLALVDPLK